MKEPKEHDKVIKYLEDAVRREYGKLISKDKALIRTKWEYDIPLEYDNKIHGECDFVYMDFEARSTYIVEVKHDYSERNMKKAKHQVFRDMWATSLFYTWAFQNGYMAWYKPKFAGTLILTDENFKVAQKYLHEKETERIKEYYDFFNKLLKIKY